MLTRSLTSLFLMVVLVAGLGCKQDLRSSISDDAPGERWIYDDWNKAVEIAAASKKPLFVVFRCVP